MFRAFVVLPAVLAVGLAVAGGIAIANPVVPQKPATSAERHELSLRKQWGFTQDLAAVRRIDAAHGDSYLGFPIDEHERAELRARSRLGAHVGSVTKVVGADPAFGGTWLINKGSGTIGVGWVGTPSKAIVASVDAAVPDPARVRFVRVAHSEKSLQALQQAVFDDVVGDAQGITPFRSSDADEVHSRVDVVVSNHATAKLLRAKYGHEGLIVTVGSGVDFQAAFTPHPAGSSGR